MIILLEYFFGFGFNEVNIAFWGCIGRASNRFLSAKIIGKGTMIPRRSLATLSSTSAAAVVSAIIMSDDLRLTN